MSGLFPTRGAPGPGGGADTYLRAPAVRRASTNQIKGFYPWVAGGGAPMIGAPLGKTLNSHGSATVCADPISSFERAGLISNPSATVIAMPGIGKSTLIRRILIYLSACGGLPWVLSDVKNEYRALISALDGAVVPIGRGRGYINPLDLGEAPAAAERLRLAGLADKGAALLADAEGRRQVAVESLISVQRGAEPTEKECLLLGIALAEMVGTPLLGDLLRSIENPTDGLLSAAQWTGDIEEYPAVTDQVRASLRRGDMERYRVVADRLRTSLQGLTTDSGLGAVFSRPTSVQVDRNRPLCFDTSGINDGERKLRSAALLSCWTLAFGALAVSHALEDNGLEASRRVCLVSDELWDHLQAPGLVDRYNRLARLNRLEGVGTLDAFHSFADPGAMASEADRRKAEGLIEKRGMLFIGGVPRSEIKRLREIVHITDREEEMIVGWSTPPSYRTALGKKPRKPGEGKFLLRIGDGADLPGIPFHLDLVPSELDGINDTNQRWSTG